MVAAFAVTSLKRDVYTSRLQNSGTRGERWDKADLPQMRQKPGERQKVFMMVGCAELNQSANVEGRGINQGTWDIGYKVMVP